MAFCVKCGAGLQAGAQFCVGCGARAESAQPAGGGAAAQPHLQAAAPAAANPRSTRSLWSEFWPYLLKRLPFMIFSFAGAFIIHLYLVYLNGGFDPGKTSEWTDYINVDANPGSSALMLWSSISGLLWSFLFALFKQGPIGAVTSIVMIPVNMVKKLFHSSMLQYGCLALGGGGALLMAAILGGNRLAGVSFGLLWVYLGLSRAGQVIAGLIFDGLIHLLSGNLGRMRPSVELIQMVLAGLGPGFMIGGLLNSGPWQVSLGMLVLIGGVVLLAIRISSKPQTGVAAAAGQVSTLLAIAAGGGAVYTLLHLLWPHKAFANDFGKPENGSFWNALSKGGVPGVIGAVQRSVTPAAGFSLGPLLPDPQLPKDDPGNPFDPPPDEQQKMWKKDHVIWDPKTLQWRQPGPGEYPPPDNPPENPPPFQKQLPRDKVPPDCLDLYDAYVHYQGVAMAGEDAVQQASQDYQKANAHLLELFAKLELLLGWEAGSIMEATRGAIKGAGGLVKSTAGIADATRSGLRDIADRAAVEAAAAESEVNSLSEAASTLRQASLDATGELVSATQELQRLKTSGVAAEQAEVDSLSEEVQTAEKTEAETEGELDVSRKGVANARRELEAAKGDAEAASNRAQRVKETVGRGKEWDALTNEQERLSKDIYDSMQEEGKLRRQADALRDQRVVPVQRQMKLDAEAALDKEAADLWMQQNELKNQMRQLDKQINDFRQARTGQFDVAAKAQQDAAVAEKEVVKGKLEQLEARAKEIDSPDYRQAMNDRIRAEAASQPLPPEEQQLQDQIKTLDEDQQVKKQRADQISQRKQQLLSKGLPAYDDPTPVETAEAQATAAQQRVKTAQQDLSDLEQHVVDKQGETKLAHEKADAARAKLKESNQKLTQAQQDNQSKIADQEAKVKQLDEKVDSLAKQEGEMPKKIEEAKKAAAEKKAEADRLGKAALDSVKDPNAPADGTAPPSGDGGAPGAGSSVSVGPQTPPGGPPLIRKVPKDTNYDPFHESVEKWKPDWAYWVEEKARNTGESVGDFMKRNFGVETSAEVAQLVMDARQEADNKKAIFDQKVAEYDAARQALGLGKKPGDEDSELKAKLDTCIAAHSFWKGDGSDGSIQ
jgi:hypothetical protein